MIVPIIDANTEIKTLFELRLLLLARSEEEPICEYLKEADCSSHQRGP